MRSPGAQQRSDDEWLIVALPLPGQDDPIGPNGEVPPCKPHGT
jgi:hypothetical protein